MKTYAKALFLALPLLLVSVAPAQHQTFTINPDSSQVAFSLGGNGHHVEGTFHVQSGSIDFDRSAQTISGSVVVAAGSGNSGEPSRDKKMNTDVLDVAHFAEVSFVPKSYQGTIAATGDSTVQVTGVFTLHGTPHDLTVPMQLHIDGGNLTAKGHFTVPYVQWGLKDPSVFILKVAKEVGIDLTLVGRLSPSS
ncbi:MAG: YceI family protein [Terracidiphilus sp.]|jgi:polyisoprenoid-binding protein YceI